MKISVGGYFFQKSLMNIQLLLNLTNITGTLHEDQCTFMIMSS